MRRQSAAYLAALFVIALAAFVGLAAWLVYGVGYLAPEAAVRAGIATDLLDGLARGREATICSVWWTPLPTLAQLVFAGIPDWVESGFAGCLLSALGGAVLCFYVARVFLDSGFGKWTSAAAALLCAANPWVALAAGSGGSQPWVLALVTAALFYFRRWTGAQSLHTLVCTSICLALLPVIAHQSTLYVLVVFGAALLSMVFVRGFGLSKIEGTVMLAVSPVVYMVGLWFLFNWLLMGNFVYFLKGVYVQPVEVAATTPLAALPGWLGGVFQREAAANVLGEMMLIAPLLPVAAVAGVMALVVRRKLLPLVVFGLLACMPLFHAFMGHRGQSFGRHDDLIIAVPLSLFLLAHSVGALRRQAAARLPVGAWAPVTAVVVVAGVLAFAALPAQRGAMPIAFTGGAPYATVAEDETAEARAIVEALERKDPDVRVAVFGFEGYRFMRALDAGGSPGDERFLHYVNWDFGLINHNTRGKALYLLVPKPEGAAQFDDVNVRFPTLYTEGDLRLDDGAVSVMMQALDERFEGWRLILANRFYDDGETSAGTQATEWSDAQLDARRMRAAFNSVSPRPESTPSEGR
ncbi:MAG: hypothetical protein JW889_11905 [Verrucomicrobia bacterium]|nr:hypothetical protein [Verrucomicrobiota bacterium]